MDKDDIDIEEIRYFMWSSIYGILSTCGNSYSNAWCEQLLTIAKKYKAYSGNVIGNIEDLTEHLGDDEELNKEMSKIGDKLFNEYLETKVF